MLPTMAQELAEAVGVFYHWRLVSALVEGSSVHICVLIMDLLQSYHLVKN
jgi:hypothetical protein